MSNIILIKYFILALILSIVQMACSKKTTIDVNSHKAPKSEKSNPIGALDTIKKTTINIPSDTTVQSINVNPFAFTFVNHSKMTDIFDVAANENKLIYVDVHAKWCAPCKLMQRDVYTHKPTSDFFNAQFINYLVDVDTLEGPDIKVIYDIHVIPTLLWLDQKGRVVHRKEGACYHADLIENAKIALKKSKQ